MQVRDKYKKNIEWQCGWGSHNMQCLDNSSCMSCSSCWQTGQVQSCIELHHSNWKKRPAIRTRKKEALFSAPSLEEETGLLSSLLLHVMWEPRVLKEVSKLPPAQYRRGGHKGIPANKAPCQPDKMHSTEIGWTLKTFQSGNLVVRAALWPAHCNL